MANFDKIWANTKEFEGGFQQLALDTANYCPGQGKPGATLIGTNHGISAIGFAHYNNDVCPTVSQIKNLSVTEAKKIAKKQYWDPIQGDKINSQAVANLIFDITYGGSSGPLHVRQAINQIKGKGTVSEFKSFTLTDAEIKLINSIPEKQLFDTLVAIRRNYYVGHTYQAGLTTRLNKLAAMYGPTLKNAVLSAQKHIVPILIIGSLFSIGLFIILKNK
jgi:lysozyme family protein